MDLRFFKWLEAKQDDRVFVVLRGLPGAGKSTTARNMLEKLGGGSDNHIFSTDNFFIPFTRELRSSGEYVSPEDESSEYKDNWDGENISKAHRENLDAFRRAVDNGVTPLILDNQNIRARDFKSYIEYADKNGYEVKIKEPDSEWWKDNVHFLRDKSKFSKELEEFAKLLHDKTLHNVPLHTIKKNIERWQCDLTVEDVLGRKPTPQYKRSNAPNKKKVEKKK